MPYREPAVVEPYPEEKTKEEIEREKRMKTEYEIKVARRNNVLGALLVTIVPCLSVLAIGWFWNHMSTPLTTAVMISAGLFSTGLFIAATIGLQWFGAKG